MAAALKRLGAATYRAACWKTAAGRLQGGARRHHDQEVERRGRNDQMYAFVSFSDPTGMFEVMLFPEVLAAAAPLLEAGKSLLITASADWDGDELKLRAASITDLDPAAAQAGEGLADPHRRRGRARSHRGPAEAAGQGAGHSRGSGRPGRGSGDRAAETPCWFRQHFAMQSR